MFTGNFKFCTSQGTRWTLLTFTPFSCLWLKVVSHKIGLCRELLGYFGLFLIRFCKEGKLSGKGRGNATQAGAQPRDAGAQLRGGHPSGEVPVCGPAGLHSWMGSLGVRGCVCAQRELESRSPERWYGQEQEVGSFQ